jgi:hypothetical protein
MKVQKYSSGWQDVEIVDDDVSPRTVEPGVPLALDVEWANADAYTTTETGNFRAYAAFRNESGGVISTEEGPLEDNYNFTVS